ncbi:MAG: hypothetical protein SPF92_04725 [Clostridia bacterium]|nr:hypothetical protein [Clostridia bacterium]
MKKRLNENKQLFMSFPVIADLRNKKLLITKETVKHLNELTYFSTITYFEYKNMYPDYEEVIIDGLPPIPVGRKIA